MNRDEAECWVYIIDEWRGGREPTVDELERLREFFEQKTTRFFHPSRRKKTSWHYKNGRVAKNGDKVVVFPNYGPPYVGVLYDATAGNDYCNGKIAIARPGDPTPNLQECLHIDDVKAALPDLASIPDTSK